jgi:CrcB protein
VSSGSSDWLLLGAIFAGGVVGALLRAALGEAFPVRAGAWPWTIFLINVGGAAALGYLVTRLQERLPPTTYRRPFLGTGFCGALTTFSTLQVEVISLGKDGHVLMAAGYLAGSIAAGLLAVTGATLLTRRARLA